MEMASSGPLSLKKLTFYSIIKGLWSRGTALPHLAKQIFDKNASREVSVSKVDFQTALITDLHHILKPKYLPNSLKVELMQCYLDLGDQLLQTALEINEIIQPSLGMIMMYLYDMVITTDLIVDVRNTLIEIAFSLRLDIYMALTATAESYDAFRKFMLHRCVSAYDMMHFLRTKQYNNLINKRTVPSFEHFISMAYSDPLVYWETLHISHKHNQRPLLARVAIQTNTAEPLEYVFQRLPENDKVTQLSSAAVAMINYTFSVPKLIFFFKNMERQVWTLFLHRNFNSIFLKTYSNPRYMHLCVPLFRQVIDHIDIATIARTLLFLIKELLDVHNDLKKDKLTPAEQIRQSSVPQAEQESIILDIWRAIKNKQQKELLQEDILKFFDILIPCDKYSLIFSFINDDLYDTTTQCGLAHQVMIGMILFDKLHYLYEFFSLFLFKGNKFISDISVIPIDAFKAFVRRDCCKNLAKYDYILSSLAFKAEDVKIKMIIDLKFICSLISAMIPNCFTAEKVNLLLKWCFNDSSTAMSDYVKNVLMKQNIMALMFWQFAKTTDEAKFNLSSFGLDYSDVLVMKRSIRNEHEEMMQHCQDLIMRRAFTYINKFELCTFENKTQLEEFLINFFHSSFGVRALNSLLIDDVNDDNTRSHCVNKYKTRKAVYEDFIKYFVLTKRIYAAIQYMLRNYVTPEAPRYSHDGSVVSLLPHESIDNFRRKCERNRRNLDLQLQTHDSYHTTLIYRTDTKIILN